jgi:hypothetical protein
MSKKKNEIVEAQSNEVALAGNLDAWGENEMTSQDMVIPKILCMQGLSDLVSEGKAKMGDFVDSLSNEVIGSTDEPVEIVPFHMEKIYIISKREKGANRYEFDRIEAVTGQNYPFEDEIDGMQFKYEYCLQFYCLRPDDTSLPYVVSFKSTSLKSGKVLSTQMFVRNRAAGLVPPAFHIELGGRKEKNDLGTFIVMEVKQGKKTSDELIGQCLDWLKIIRAGKTRVEHNESNAAPQTESAHF